MAENMTTASSSKAPSTNSFGVTPLNDDAIESMIMIDHVSMIFNMASEQLNSLKEYAISLARRELRFKEFRALDDVSLTVKRGDVFGIMGTNGSGKSTLLKIIAGVLDPTNGSCTVNGTIAPLIELGAGFDLELTARENIYLNGALLGYSKEFINEHFDEIVNFAEVRDFLDIPLKNYSSGMVARIAFAIATVIVPDILIVDEVLSVGDFMFQQKCERRIQTLIREYGVTVLIVSHNTDQIERLCNKAIWIEKGHTRMVGPADEICQIYRVLGGRSGTIESERILLELFEQLSTERADIALTNISSQTRYELSTRLFMQDSDTRRKDLVVAYGTDFMASILASSLASAEEADILNMNDDCFSEALEREIEQRQYSRIVLVQGDDEAPRNFKDRLKSLVLETSLEELNANKPSKLSLSVFDLAKEDGCNWSRTALLCAPHNRADLISISSFLFSHNIPIFFIDETGTIPPETLAKINTFDSVILLGGSISFPESCLTGLDPRLETTRLYGENPYDAYLKIRSWIESRSDESEDENTKYFIASFADIERITSVGLFARRNHGDLHLYSDQDADSVAAIIKDLREKKISPEDLYIIGITASLNDASISLFSQAAASL